jgi:hypothetical protein
MLCKSLLVYFHFGMASIPPSQDAGDPHILDSTDLTTGKIDAPRSSSVSASMVEGLADFLESDRSLHIFDPFDERTYSISREQYDESVWRDFQTMHTFSVSLESPKYGAELAGVI